MALTYLIKLSMLTIIDIKNLYTKKIVIKIISNSEKIVVK